MKLRPRKAFDNDREVRIWIWICRDGGSGRVEGGGKQRRGERGRTGCE